MTYEEARASFPVLERFAYLNAGSLGPLSRATIDAMAERNRYDHEQGRGGKPWVESMLSLRARVREQLARTIGTSPDRLALTSSTTDGCNIVLAGFDLRPGDEVVTTSSEHPGLLAPLHASGADVRVADVTGVAATDVGDAILSQVTPRTRLLALSHVLWTVGHIVPVHELKRATGLPMLVDGAQSVGAIPVDVGDLDFYTVSCQKWLCGPEPTGALYVRDPERLRVALPTYFSLQSIERDGTFVPGTRGARSGARRRARVAFRACGGDGARVPGRGRRALRARHARRGGHARVLRGAGRRVGARAAALRARRDRARPPGHGLAPRELRVVDGRERPRPPRVRPRRGSDPVTRVRRYDSGSGAYRSITVPSGSISCA